MCWSWKWGRALNSKEECTHHCFAFLPIVAGRVKPNNIARRNMIAVLSISCMTCLLDNLANPWWVWRIYRCRLHKRYFSNLNDKKKILVGSETWLFEKGARILKFWVASADVFFLTSTIWSQKRDRLCHSLMGWLIRSEWCHHASVPPWPMMLEDHSRHSIAWITG